MFERHDPTSPVYVGDLYPKDIKKVIQPKFLKELAKFHNHPSGSKFQIALGVWTELDEYHSGQLYAYPEEARPENCNGLEFRAFAIDGIFEKGLDAFEFAWGKDWARSMGRFLDRAERPYTNQMKCTDKLLLRITLLDFARTIQKHRLKSSSQA